jgi:very-short-patch-repair endonuclease
MEIRRDEHYGKFLERCKEFIDLHTSQVLESHFNITESPLENFFAISFKLSCLNHNVASVFNKYELLPQMGIDHAGDLNFYNKKKTDKFRLDFVLLNLNAYCNYIEGKVKSYNKIGIEIDGFEFHEKTKEQFEREKVRNRFLTKYDWKIFYFAGTEIYNNPFGCVMEIYEYLA